MIQFFQICLPCKIKKNRFYRLEISKWTKEETVASVIFYSLQKKHSINDLKDTIWMLVHHHMHYICNQTYCDTVLEVYTLFNIFKLYPEECIKGYIQYFSGDYYPVEKKNI